MSRNIKALSKHLLMVLLGVQEPDLRALNELLRLAERNKVLLAFLRRAGVQGGLREVEERRYVAFIEWLGRVAEALESEGVEHIFIKLIRPAEYVPADIDVLVRPEDVTVAASTLEGLGLRILVKEPFTVTMGGQGVLVDLYTYPSFAHTIYLSPDVLWRGTRTEALSGVVIKVPSREGEVALAVSHAIYKEGVFTANDALTVMRWGSPHLSAYDEFFVGDAYRLSLSIITMVLEGRAVLPFKVSLALRAYLLGRKALRDKVFRRTLPRALAYLRDARAGIMLMKHLRTGQ